MCMQSFFFWIAAAAATENFKKYDTVLLLLLLCQRTGRKRARMSNKGIGHIPAIRS